MICILTLCHHLLETLVDPFYTACVYFSDRTFCIYNGHIILHWLTFHLKVHHSKLVNVLQAIQYSSKQTPNSKVKLWWEA